MSNRILVIDTRLSAKSCKVAAPVVQPDELAVDGNTALSDCMQKIKLRAGAEKIERLTILAHGFGHLGSETVDGRVHGGLGLEFCAGGLNVRNAHEFKALRGLFANSDLGISLIACAAADSAHYQLKNGTKVKGQGEELCFAIAESAGTGVLASSNAQDVVIQTMVYKTRRGREVVEETEQCADPGTFEGSVWLFGRNRKKSAPPRGR